MPFPNNTLSATCTYTKVNESTGEDSKALYWYIWRSGIMREQRLFSRFSPAIAFTNNILVSYICTALTDQILFIFYEVCMTAF